MENIFQNDAARRVTSVYVLFWVSGEKIGTPKRQKQKKTFFDISGLWYSPSKNFLPPKKLINVLAGGRKFTLMYYVHYIINGYTKQT